MIYDVKKDWFIYPLVPAIFVMIGAGLLILYVTATHPGVPLPLLAFSVALIALAAFFYWLLTSAGYEITATELTARMGPFRFRVALDDIVCVVPTHKLFGHGPAWNYALSQDRIFIRYRTKKGGMALLGLALSPKDKVGFLHELLEAVPQLQLCKDGTLRRPKAPDADVGR